MATLLDLRRRVRSVKNIRQITRAMRMVAASKLRRTQDRIINSRPYSDKAWEVMNGLAERTENRDHPLLRRATSFGGSIRSDTCRHSPALVMAVTVTAGISATDIQRSRAVSTDPRDSLWERTTTC